MNESNYLFICVSGLSVEFSGEYVGEALTENSMVYADQFFRGEV